MPRRNFNDLIAFLTVAREGNFTRSASTLGITQSALSQAIKSLEAHLKIRLFTRTTRSVSLTEAGERLFAAIAGLGLAFLLEDELAPHIQSGQLMQVLKDWCPLFPGYFLFYPSRRYPSPAFSLVLDALRIQ